MKAIRKSPITRLIAWIMVLLCLLWDARPLLAYSPAPKPLQVQELRHGLTQTPSPELQRKIAAKEAQKQPDARVLSLSEMKSIRGRGPYRNSALCGTRPWWRTFRDVNLINGNLMKSFTDIQAAPARGAGLVMQRTYNTQDDHVGPWGLGWSNPYDTRLQTDPGNSNQMIRTDFFGGKHTYVVDADGLLSAPVYLHDQITLETSPAGGDTATGYTDTSLGGFSTHFVPNGSIYSCDRMQDRAGNTTQLSYNGTITLPDGSHPVQSVTDPIGRSLTFTWSNVGVNGATAWRITAAQGPQYRVTYDYFTDPASPNAANELYNLKAVHLDPTGLNRTMSYTYTGVTGPAGAENGLLASVTDPLGHSVSYAYGALPSYYVTTNVWVSQVTEPPSRIWHINPDHHGTNVQADNQLVNEIEVSISYSLLPDRVSPAEDTNGVAFTYDNANNIIQESTCRGAGVARPDPFVTKDDSFTYGPYGNQLTHRVVGFPGVETTTYYGADRYFQKQSVTDMNGRTSTMDYFTRDDANPGNRGKVKWVQDARYGVTGKQFSYSYNQYGQKVSETNLNNVVTQYTYGDQWGNLTQVAQDPGGLNRTTSMTYDVAGHVLSSTDPMQQQSSVTYNVLGQPLTASFPVKAGAPAETISYGYGGNGRTESVTDNRGTTTLSYVNGTDQVSSATDPVTGTVSYTYGWYGERRTMSLAGGGTWTYGYDTQLTVMPGNEPDRYGPMLNKITDDQGRVVEIYTDALGAPYWVRSNKVFDQGGNLVSYCQADYTDEVNNSDPNNLRSRLFLSQLKNTWHWYGSDTPGGYMYWHSRVLSQNDYTYDTAGSRLTNTITSSTGAQRVEQYGYDELNRLGTVNYGDGTQGYSFDPMGNRLQKTDSATGTENYSYDNANRLVSRGSNPYVNDADGNTLTGGGRNNTWDSQNRLVQCITGTSTCQYAYGADGLRRQSTISSGQTTTTTDFVLDGQSVVRERRNGANYATYLTGPTGPLYRRSDVDGTVRWYVFDGLGSVVGEVDPSGNLTATRACDVYGATRGGAGTATSKHGFVGQLGHTTEPETGLVYMRARYYDPAVGRFVSEDPSKDGNDWYIYADCNPAAEVDRNGKNGIIATGALSLATAMETIGSGFAATLVTGAKFADVGARAVRGSAIWDFLVQRAEDPRLWRYAMAAIEDSAGRTGVLKAWVKMEAHLVVAAIYAEGLAEHEIPYVAWGETL